MVPQACRERGREAAAEQGDRKRKCNGRHCERCLWRLTADPTPPSALCSTTCVPGPAATACREHTPHAQRTPHGPHAQPRNGRLRCTHVAHRRGGGGGTSCYNHHRRPGLATAQLTSRPLPASSQPAHPHSSHDHPVTARCPGPPGPRAGRAAMPRPPPRCAAAPHCCPSEGGACSGCWCCCCDASSSCVSCCCSAAIWLTAACSCLHSEAATTTMSPAGAGAAGAAAGVATTAAGAAGDVAAAVGVAASAAGEDEAAVEGLSVRARGLRGGVMWM